MEQASIVDVSAEVLDPQTDPGTKELTEISNLEEPLPAFNVSDINGSC